MFKTLNISHTKNPKSITAIVETLLNGFKVFISGQGSRLPLGRTATIRLT